MCRMRTVNLSQPRIKLVLCTRLIGLMNGLMDSVWHGKKICGIGLKRNAIMSQRKPCGHLDSALFGTLAYSLTRSVTHSLSRLLTYSLTRSLTHSLTHSLTRSLARSLTHSLTYSLTRLLARSLTQSLDDFQ